MNEFKEKDILDLFDAGEENTQNEYLTPDNSSKNKRYFGKVMDNNDPEKLGRCKVYVFSVFDGIDTKDLPWAIPEVGGAINSMVIPPLDSMVRVYFDNDNIYSPIYISKVTDTNNTSSEALIDYPDNLVLFETNEGEYHTINRKSNTTAYHCANGAFFYTDTDGNLNVDLTECNDGNINIIDKNGNNIQMNSDGTRIKDKNVNVIEMSSDGISLSDLNMNTFEMSELGVRVNGQYIVTQNFLSDLISVLAPSFGLGGTGPVAVSPTAIATMTAKMVLPASVGGYFSTPLPPNPAIVAQKAAMTIADTQAEVLATAAIGTEMALLAAEGVCTANSTATGNAKSTMDDLYKKSLTDPIVYLAPWQASVTVYTALKEAADAIKGTVATAREADTQAKLLAKSAKEKAISIREKYAEMVSALVDAVYTAKQAAKDELKKQEEELLAKLSIDVSSGCDCGAEV